MPLARAVTPLARAVMPLARAVMPLARAVMPLARAVTPLARAVMPLATAATSGVVCNTASPGIANVHAARSVPAFAGVICERAE